MAVATVIGSGRMGAWFAGFLKKSGYRIIISDKNQLLAKKLAAMKGYWYIKDPKLAVQHSRLVLVATPTHVTGTILEEIEPYLSRKTLLIEMSSVKELVRRRLQAIRKRGTAVLSIHPMFGPGIRSLKGKTMITALLPAGNTEAAKLLSLFRKSGAKIVRSNFAEHDKFVSMVLALPHFMNIVMVNTLKSYGIPPNRLKAMGGTTFKLQLLTAEAIYWENPGNEASILMDSKQSLIALRMFLKNGRRTLSVLGRGARGAILQDFKNGRSYLAKDEMFAKAYRQFNAAVEASSLD